MIKGTDTLFPSDRESVGKCPRCGGAVRTKMAFVAAIGLAVLPFRKKTVFYRKEKDRKKGDCHRAFEKRKNTTHRLLFRKDRQGL